MLIGPLYGLHNITLPRFRAISYSAPSRSIYEDRSAHDTSPAGPTVSTSASTAGRECMVSLAVARYLSNASPRACNYGFSCVTVNPHARYIIEEPPLQVVDNHEFNHEFTIYPVSVPQSGSRSVRESRLRAIP